MPSNSPMGVFDSGRFFSLTSIDVQKNIMFKHTQFEMIFSQKIEVSQPPPPPKKKPTLLGTNISYPKALLKMIFLFPKLDMLVPWRVLLEGTFPTFSPFVFTFFLKSLRFFEAKTSRIWVVVLWILMWASCWSRRPSLGTLEIFFRRIILPNILPWKTNMSPWKSMVGRCIPY